MISSPPEDGLRLSERLDLSLKQKECFRLLKDDIHTEILYGGGAGGGKSFLGCAWLIRNCLRYPGTRWLMGRSELKTLKSTTLKTFFEVGNIIGLMADTDYSYRQQQGEIRFDNGSEIVLADLKYYPNDPNFDRLGSLEITGGFIDECNQLIEKARDVVKSRIRFRLDEYGLVPKLLMTCNPAKNWTYNQFYKPSRTGTLEEKKAFVQALIGDNPKISRHYLENLDGLPRLLRLRLRDGMWEYDDDVACLVPYDRIIEMWTNRDVPPGPMYLTCDAARYGGDKAKIFVWSGWRLTEVKSLERCSMTDLAGQISHLMDRHGIPPANVVIDEDGVGGGCVDILRKEKGKAIRGFVNNSRALPENKVNGKTAPNYANLKAQCYYRIADRINARGVFIEADVLDSQAQQELAEELEQVKVKNLDRDTRLDIVPKETVKELLGRSPDLSDCLMFREVFELKPVKKPIFV